MRKISIERAIEILEEHGYLRAEIDKMGIEEFISKVNILIGKVESIAFVNGEYLTKNPD